MPPALSPGPSSRWTEATLLADLIDRASASCDGLERVADGPALPAQVSSLVIVGPSCSGKTSLVDILRGARIPNTTVPLRFVTRPLRANESLDENQHVTVEAFENGERDGSIAWSWERLMVDSNLVQYGFAASDAHSFAIYSGNNSLVSNSDSISSRNLLGESLWVGVLAPHSIRKQRMQRRSPDLSEREREHRLSDMGDEMRRNVHLLAHNVGQSPELLGRTLSSLVAELALQSRSTRAD